MDDLHLEMDYETRLIQEKKIQNDENNMDKNLTVKLIKGKLKYKGSSTK
jgi:hypothetical protein